MTEAEIEAMKAENATLKANATDFATQLAEKDRIIEQKTQDIVGARKKYQKLSEMPKEEVEAMTEQERKLKAEQDVLAEQQEESMKQQAEDRKKEVDSRKLEVARKLVGDNPVLIEKVLKNFDRIKDADTAFTAEEISHFMNDSVNMLGEERPDPVRTVFNGAGGGQAPGVQADDYAGTDAGKALGTMLNLGSAQPAPTEVKK